MNVLDETRKPPFYAVIYTSPPGEGDNGENDPTFGETASLLVSLAAMQPGYLGFRSEQAAEGRTVAVCYWDSFKALSDWTDDALEWTPLKPGLDAFVCATGCLWLWLFDEHRVSMETAARYVA